MVYYLNSTPVKSVKLRSVAIVSNSSRVLAIGIKALFTGASLLSKTAVLSLLLFPIMGNLRCLAYL
jgi:hypothetical protein